MTRTVGDVEASKTRAVGGASGGTLVDVLLANVIREGTLRNAPKQ